MIDRTFQNLEKDDLAAEEWILWPRIGPGSRTRYDNGDVIDACVHRPMRVEPLNDLGVCEVAEIASVELLRVGTHYSAGGAVVEYTNTFHFPEAGEMMITLGDFAWLTGPRVGHNPLLLDPWIHEHEGVFYYLLGKTPDVSESGHVTSLWLQTQYDRLSLGGHHCVLELWAFEYLLLFPPPTRHREPRFVPWAAHWLKGVRRTRSPAMDETSSGPFDGGSGIAHFVFMPSSHFVTLMLFPQSQRQPATGFLQAGDYSAFHWASLALPTTTTTVAPPVWPRAPSFISFHNANGEEKHLALSQCATQFYVLPSGVQQVPADIVQEWLRTF
ncbi:hypothetical protein RHMOL_Rhmol02G0181500 [Rhododendron molle]|uniref:Uncharacterized protein n=1 Tax=Rhododendron molle TaxID=49168 RepID=A0ACC0PUJ9_RHOML|nr:hypothetical protein RHMOL_Rhmol02G0181500 [Rhododendron molle]